MQNYYNALKFKVKLFTLLLLSFSVFSCAANHATQYGSSLENSSGASAEHISGDRETSRHPHAALLTTSPENKMNETPAAEPSIDPAYTGDYVIGPEDLLEISVYQVDELNRTVRVSSSGYIKLPLVDTIKVDGLTAAEIENEISRKLDRYLQEPTVSIFVKEYRSQNITVLGAVSKPQVYTVTRQKFLIDMLSMAGGITDDAGDVCYVRRGNETIIIRIKDLLIGGDMRLNIPLVSGDIVQVPAGGVIFVDGSVNKPGAFTMKGTTTLTQAIAMASGFKYEAIKDQIRVYRDTGTDTRDIIDVDYEAILDKESPDIILEDKDVVIVARSGAKALWQGFVRSISGALRIGSVSVGGGL